MVYIAGSSFYMGSNKFYPEERPVVSINVSSFWIDKFEVTNKDFSEFVDSTAYVTFAELVPLFKDYPEALPELLVPGSLVFQQLQATEEVQHTWHNWWKWTPGASWKHPTGASSSIASKGLLTVNYLAVKGTIQLFTFLSRMPKLTVIGGVNNFPLRLSGNMLPKVASVKTQLTRGGILSL